MKLGADTTIILVALAGGLLWHTCDKRAAVERSKAEVDADSAAAFQRRLEGVLQTYGQTQADYDQRIGTLQQDSTRLALKADSLAGSRRWWFVQAQDSRTAADSLIAVIEAMGDSSGAQLLLTAFSDADSARAACMAELETCEERRENAEERATLAQRRYLLADSLLSAATTQTRFQDDLIARLSKGRPWTHQWGERLLFAGLGFGFCEVRR